MSWTTPADLKAQVQKLWDRGTLLSSLVTEGEAFPKRLLLKGPSSQELLDRFEDARAWARAVLDLPHLRFEMREARHRVLGTNSLPNEAWVDSVEAAVALLGKGRDVGTYQRLAREAATRCPGVLPWLAKRPLKALELSEAWGALLSVVEWLQAHPRPGVYLRQVDVPGVHTKVIEANRGVLTELLDLALPAAQVDEGATGVQGFNQRFGFLDEPVCIRFRVLDPNTKLLPGLGTPDVALDAVSFAKLGPIANRVFIVENKTNFLSFPLVKEAIVVFGAGYGLGPLGLAVWMQECNVHYWGDLDTHGFAILDELRGHFPAAESFLMDRETLFAHQALWGTEAKPTNRELHRLTPPEQALYDDLRYNKIQYNLRLEQEQIDFSRVAAAI